MSIDGSSSMPTIVATARTHSTHHPFLNALTAVRGGMDWEACRAQLRVAGSHAEPRTATTQLVKAWLLLSPMEKIAILSDVVWSGDPMWLHVFLGELVLYGIALEPSPAVAHVMRAAVHSVTTSHAPTAIFLLEYIAQHCSHDWVVAEALEDADAFRRRVAAIGR